MSIITLPTFLVKGTDNIITLDKSELLLDSIVAADSYFNQQSNWGKIIILYESTEGGQKQIVSFDATETSPQGVFNATTTSRDAWEVQSLTIFDNDKGSLRLSREDLNVVDFDTDFSVPVAASLFITQQPTDIGTDTNIAPAITVEIRDQFGALFSSTAQVDVAIDSGTGVLSGDVDVNAVAGVATFSDLQIDSGDTFTLEFTSAGLVSTTSDSFDIIAPITGLTWNTTGSAGTFVTTDDSYERTDAGGPPAFIQANEEIASGDVRLEFTVGSSNVSHTIGLDGSPHVTGDGDEAFIDHGFKLFSGNSYTVRIGGSQGYHNGNYISGDVFKIEVVDGTVTYYKNGDVVYTFGGTFSSYPIKLSSVLTGQGDKAYGIIFDDQPVGPPWLYSGGALPWFNVTGTSIVKIANANNFGNNVLYNTELTGDASIEFTIDLAGGNSSGKFMMIGFQDAAPNETSAGYSDIKAGIYFNTTAGCNLVTNGTFDTNTGESWADNDTFKLEKIGSNLNFYKNGSGTPFYVHTISPAINDPFKPSFSIYSLNTGVDNIIVTDL